MKKLFILLAAAMILLPLANALDCNGLKGGDFLICKSIQESDLTSKEKDLLILDIFNENKAFPNHDFVYSWNINLDIKNSPDNKLKSEGIIKNAWLSLISIMPSVLENETLYVPVQAKILAKYNYESELPSKTVYGDCKTYYYPESQKEKLSIYLNNRLVGHEELSNFHLINEDDTLDFLAVLEIEAGYKVEHYKERRYCTEYFHRYCITYKTKCEYSYTQYHTDTLTLTDTLGAKASLIKPNSNLEIKNKYNGITQGVLEADNFTNLILNFEGSQYQNSKYVYSYDYKLPYYVLTLKAEEYEQETTNNLHIDKLKDNITFTVKNPEDCEIQLFTHFDSQTKNCDLSYNLVEFGIKTDKLNYYENETINIEIFPKNTELELIYNNQTIKSKNNAQFQAVLYENKITASLDGRETDEIINVRSLENKALFYDFFSLSFIGFVFYSVIKKYYISAAI